MGMELFRASALPFPPTEYDRQYVDQLINVLRLYFSQLDSDTPRKAFSYRADRIILNPNVTPALTSPGMGQLQWNSVDETLDLGMQYGVIQQIGQETYARVQNVTGTTIPNGTLVGFSGVGVDNTLQVAPYLADGSQPSLYVLGVLTHDLPDSGELGYCTVFGYVRGLDTTGTPVGETWSVGDILYANPSFAGQYTKFKPTAPDNVVPVAAVLMVDATDGVIFVRPTIDQQRYYGTFLKTDSQTPAAANTAYPITFTSTQVANGVTIGTPASRLVVVESGLYTCVATVQITSGNSSAKNVWVWFRKNGVDVPATARVVTTDINGGYVPVTVSDTISLMAGEYIELVFASSDTNVSLSTLAATAFAPAAPAALISVTQTQL